MFLVIGSIDYVIRMYFLGFEVFEKIVEFESYIVSIYVLKFCRWIVNNIFVGILLNIVNGNFYWF